MSVSIGANQLIAPEKRGGVSEFHPWRCIQKRRAERNIPYERTHHANSMRRVFSPFGRPSNPGGASDGWGQPNALVVSGGCDKELRVWDVKSGYALLSPIRAAFFMSMAD